MNRRMIARLFLSSALVVIIGACAKISSPSGGPKDRTPPVVVKSIPVNGARNFRGNKLEIVFNEYVALDNINEKFMVSPPMKKKPRVFLKGKAVEVEFDDKLKDSTTYTFYFQDGIKDLNEGNILQNYQFVISTGPVIDSLSVTGNIYNAFDLNVPEKTEALLYRELADSAVVKHLPEYISRVDQDGYFRIDKILKGQNWTGQVKSPLTEIGVNASEGDFILAVDGKPVNKMNNIYEALVNKAGRQVNLTLNNIPSELGKREVTVMPIDDESQLYYLNWVNNNMEKVNKATNGRVGYLHIPNMGVDGLNEFIKYYFPQLEKEALVVDVRGNGGGFVSSIIIENLRRVAAMISVTRNSKPDINPDGTLYGPMVMLCDEFSASDGDIVTYRFKTYNMGKVVGKRTWGGVTGIRGTLPLVDGGFLSRPEFSIYDLEGKKWIIEGIGVEPDIVVDNDPYLEYTGTDQQLNKAIEVILDDLKTKAKKIPDHPPYPVK